jgi:PAS domain S-box-containing protein
MVTTSFRWRLPFWQILVALAYLGSGWVGLRLALVEANITVVWPPTGIAIAALVIGGWRWWPAVTLGALAVNLLSGAPPAVSLAVAFGNTVGPLLSALLLQRVGFDRRFSHRRDTGWFCVAVMAGLIIPPTVGVTALDLGGVVPWAGERWVMWWLGDVVGALVVGPLLLSWDRRRVVDLVQPARLIEAAVLVLVVVGMGVAVFLEVGRVSMAFLMLPPVVWSALRFGLWPTSVTVITIAAFAAWGTALGGGPFAVPGASTHLLLASFLGTMALLNLLLAGLLAEREQAEDRLRASEERLRLAIDHAHMATWEFDLRSGRLMTSGRRQELFGSEMPTDRAGFLAHAHADDRARVEQAITRCITERGRLNVEFRVLQSAGECWVALEGEVSDDAGQPRLSGIVRDITPRKRAEEERVRLEAALLQAQKLKAVGTLAGGIAHDFNNVLSVILNATELARSELPGEHPLHPRLRVIAHAGTRARDLVRQILTFSRGQEVHHVPLRAETVVGEVVAFLRATLPSTVVLDSQIAAHCPMILGDATQLHQVLMNLGTNAWQSLSQQRGCITLAVELLEITAVGRAPCPGLAPGRYLHLSVSDTGQGMDEQTVARIFEPFFTTKPLGQGTGLGLAVAHGIITDHQGAIAVESRPGQGSTFHLCIPALTQAEETALSAAVPARAATPVTPPMAVPVIPHVLLVDDEDLLVELGIQLLTTQGFRVTGFTDPHAALAAVRQQPRSFDVVITDLTMPGMTGLELAGELHQVRADLPIILASGYGGDVTPERAARVGIRQVIDKPAPPGALARSIWAVLKSDGV